MTRGAPLPVAVLSAALLLGWGAPVNAQVDSLPTVPRLYGHTWVAAPMLRSLFVRTSVRNTIGLGQASDLDYGSVILPEGDTLVSLEGNITVATLQFAYEHELRPWLSAWGEFEVGARTGTEATSILSTGVTYGSSFELGWLARLRQTDRSILSIHGNVGSQSVTFVDLPAWVAGLVSGEREPLLRTVPALRVGGGAQYGWVLNEVVAFSISGSGARGEAVRVREESWFFSSGVSASVNFEDRYSVPIGLGVTLRADSNGGLESLEGFEEGGWEAASLRIAYTGRPNLQIGLTTTGRRVPFREGEEMLVRDLAFGMRYFF